MNARNRVFVILALLTIGSLIWYFATVRPTGDLQIIGTVDANEVQVSARIPGRIQTLTVKEGDTVKAGQLIAVIESDDLDAALKAAEATAIGMKSKLNGSVQTERQNSGETASATVSAEAQVRVAEASLAQAKAQLDHQPDQPGEILDALDLFLAAARVAVTCSLTIRSPKSLISFTSRFNRRFSFDHVLTSSTSSRGTCRLVLFPATFLQRIVASCRSPAAQRQLGFPHRTFTAATDPAMNGPTAASSRSFASRCAFSVFIDSCLISHLIVDVRPPWANL